MAESPVNSDPDVRPYAAVFVAQLVLTVLAVLVSRVEELGTSLGVAAVMLVAAINAGMVAFFTMGIRRDGRLITWLAVLTLLIIVGLLVWPAWDIGGRGRVF